MAICERLPEFPTNKQASRIVFVSAISNRIMLHQQPRLASTRTIGASPSTMLSRQCFLLSRQQQLVIFLDKPFPHNQANVLFARVPRFSIVWAVSWSICHQNYTWHPRGESTASRPPRPTGCHAAARQRLPAYPALLASATEAPATPSSETISGQTKLCMRTALNAAPRQTGRDHSTSRIFTNEPAKTHRRRYRRVFLLFSVQFHQRRPSPIVGNRLTLE